MSKKFPLDRIGTFQGLKKQIAFEMNVFNLHRMYGEYQKSYGIFAEILLKLLHQPVINGKQEISVNKERAELYLKLFYGDPGLQPGLYALDIIQRKTEGKYSVICRGLGETDTAKANLDPEKHHKAIMNIYGSINPVMFALWHKIGDQVAEEGLSGIKLKWKVEEGEPQIPSPPDDTNLIEDGILQQFPTTIEELAEMEGE